MSPTKVSRRDSEGQMDFVTVPKSAEARLRMIKLPGEQEPTPQVFVCPTCGEDTRLVMVRVGARRPNSRSGSRRAGNEADAGQFLLQVTRRQVEQLLAEFQQPD
jgi:hypothetical protein